MSALMNLKSLLELEMKILIEQPPILDKILKAEMKPQKTTIFAYKNAIWNPSGVEIPPDILVHEEVHLKQQEGANDDWYDKYLMDKDFRLKMEVEAFREQYKFFCEMVKDRNLRARYLNKLALNLSSEIYGKIINLQTAINKLK